MKNLLLLLFAVWSLGIMADGIDVNGDFREPANPWPAGWVQNKGNWARPWGEVKVLKEGQGRRLQITGTAKVTEIYREAFMDIKAGDVFEITLKARGNGTINSGFYVYAQDAKNWLRNISTQFTVKDESAEYKATVEIIDGKPTEESMKTPAGKGRIFFGAGPHSKVIIDEIKVVRK